MSTMPRNSDASKALRPTQIEALRKSIEFEIARIIANNSSHVNSYVLSITSELAPSCANPGGCGTSAVSSSGLAPLRWETGHCLVIELQERKVAACERGIKSDKDRWEVPE